MIIRAVLSGAKVKQNLDPTNYSAHRFLADSYAVLPRHEIARVSEVLQSQLLQPLNVNPIPPRAALARPFILNAASPTTPAFNEFTPLFNRNRLSVLASGVAGGNDTFGDDVALSAVWNQFSVSLGRSHFETEGFRENNDLERNIYDVLGQVALTPDASVLVELRSDTFERGDLQLRFDPSNFDPTQRQRDREDSIRLGGRVGLGPGGDVIATAVYQMVDAKSTFDPGRRFTTDEHGVTVEAQHLYRRDRLGLVSGIGHVQLDRDDRFEFPSFVDISETSVRHTNAYLYLQVALLAGMTATVGMSAEFFDDGMLERRQVNPKVGFMWTPMPTTTVRAAAFRTLKKPLTANQTIEPTQVAGFNQLFDDADGTDAWRYGIGVDQKLSRTLFVGAEATRRETEVPFLDSSTGTLEVREAQWDEDAARAYVYWTPYNWLALGAEYQYEALRRDLSLDEGVTRAWTHRVPITVSLFHPSGLRGRVRTTFVAQEGTFENAQDEVFWGHDTFVVTDATIGYLLPRRLGLIEVEARNLIGTRFRYQDTDPANPRIYPERLVVGRVTVAY